MRTFRIGKRRTGMIRQIRVVVGTHQRCLGEIRRCPRLLRSRCPRFWFKRSHRRWHRRWLRPRRSRHWRRTRRHRLYHGNRFYLQNGRNPGARNHTTDAATISAPTAAIAHSTTPSLHPRLPSCRGKTLATISIRFTVVLCRRISPHRLASRVFHAGDLRNDG